MAYVYDGLFYIALMLQFFGLNGDCLYRTDSQGNANLFYKASFILNGHLITQKNINKFMQFLAIINQRYQQLNNINLFFKNLNEPRSRTYNGGEKEDLILKPMTIQEYESKQLFNNEDLILQDMTLEKMSIIFNESKNEISEEKMKIILKNINKIGDMNNNDDKKEILKIQHNIKKTSSNPTVVYNEANPIDLNLQVEKYKKIFS